MAVAPHDEPTIAILGGTGAFGRGLAARFARSGLAVGIGSRDPHRSAATMETLAEQVGTGRGRLHAGTNVEVAADAEVVVIAVPWEALGELLDVLEPATAGKIVVCAVNPLGFDDRGPYPIVLAAGSAAQQVADALPRARVVAALHTLSSHVLAHVEQPADDDVPVVGDDEAAVAQVVALVERIPGCRGVAAGPLRLAGALEQLVSVLIGVNQRSGVHTGIRFARL